MQERKFVLFIQKKTTCLPTYVLIHRHNCLCYLLKKKHDLSSNLEMLCKVHLEPIAWLQWDLRNEFSNPRL